MSEKKGFDPKRYFEGRASEEPPDTDESKEEASPETEELREEKPAGTEKPKEETPFDDAPGQEAKKEQRPEPVRGYLRKKEGPGRVYFGERVPREPKRLTREQRRQELFIPPHELKKIIPESPSEITEQNIETIEFILSECEKLAEALAGKTRFKQYAILNSGVREQIESKIQDKIGPVEQSLLIAIKELSMFYSPSLATSALGQHCLLDFILTMRESRQGGKILQRFWDVLDKIVFQIAPYLQEMHTPEGHLGGEDTYRHWFGSVRGGVMSTIGTAEILEHLGYKALGATVSQDTMGVDLWIAPKDEEIPEKMIAVSLKSSARDPYGASRVSFDIFPVEELPEFQESVPRPRISEEKALELSEKVSRFAKEYSQECDIPIAPAFLRMSGREKIVDHFTGRVDIDQIPDESLTELGNEIARFFEEIEKNPDLFRFKPKKFAPGTPTPFFRRPGNKS